MATTQFEGVLQSAVRGLLVMVRQIRAFVVANEKGREVSCFREFDDSLVAWYDFVIEDPDVAGGAFPVGEYTGCHVYGA